jgi:hypothetical protein
MQNQNENDGFRRITRYPRYEIDTNGFVRTAKGKQDVPFLKRRYKRGLVQVSLEYKDKKYKESVMDLLEETFTAKEIMGEEEYEAYVNGDDSSDDDSSDDEDEGDENESDEECQPGQHIWAPEKWPCAARGDCSRYKYGQHCGYCD